MRGLRWIADVARSLRIWAYAWRQLLREEGGLRAVWRNSAHWDPEEHARWR